MLHPRFVIHNNVPVVAGHTVHEFAQEQVGVAVAVWTFTPAHRHQVEPLALNHSVIELDFQVRFLGHPRRDIDFLFIECGNDGADGLPDVQAQALAQIGIGVGIHGQNRLQAILFKVADYQAGYGGLATAAFAGNRNIIAQTLILSFWLLFDPPASLLLTAGNSSAFVCGRKSAAT